MRARGKQAHASSADRISDAARWAAVEQRDAAFDGKFYYSVASTGVYCRPSCPSRSAKRENVTFHATADAAEACGFRPCKRCKPKDPPSAAGLAGKIARACRLIEDAEEAPALAELAAAAGMSPYHFHRIFKATAGVTPKAYAIAHRNKKVREQLNGSGTVTAAIHSAGFNSNTRFYADASGVLGMSPGAYRKRGKNEQIRFAVGNCWLGTVLVGASEKGICAILLGSSTEALISDLEQRFSNATIVRGDKAFKKIVARVISHVEKPSVPFDLPLDIRGTAFQHRVWQALRAIPPGSTVSYAQIAEKIGKPKSARAVAGACAANTIAVAIPCHRVVRGDGNLSGYRWGITRKRKLLEKENKS